MVQRNLRQPFNFVCIEDVPGFSGWWTKIALFQPGRFTGRVFYSDLDSVITGQLDELVETKGVIDLHDWGWTTHTYGTGAMCWDAGEHKEIYEDYTPDVPQQFRGDQDWATHLGGWQALPAHLCRSYRYHAKKEPPPGCVHCSMHGEPKPHEIVGGWVPKAWVG